MNDLRASTTTPTPAIGRTVTRLFGFSRLLAVSSLLAGAVVLVACSIGLLEQLQAAAGTLPAHPASVLAALLLATSVLASSGSGRGAQALADAGALCVIASMAAGLLFPRYMPALFDFALSGFTMLPLVPGQAPALNTALCLLLLGTALLLRRPRRAAISQALAFLSTGLPALSLLGHLLGVQRFHGNMPLSSVLVLLPLCASVALVSVRNGFLRVLLGPGRVSAITRRYLLLVMLLPYLVGLAMRCIVPEASSLPAILLIVASSQLAGLVLSFFAVALARVERGSNILRLRAERRMHRDELTGALRRAHFTHRAGEVLCKRSRHDGKVSVLFIDIDHFKRINDRFGHTTGDHVLKRVIRLVRRSIRRDDMVARWGGEEFVVLLPETDLQGAAVMAEKVRRTVASEVLEDIGVPLRVTLSIGCAEIRDDELLDDMVARADAALYRAKSAGRNRTAFAA